MHLAILVGLAGLTFAAIAPRQIPDPLNVSVSVPEPSKDLLCDEKGFPPQDSTIQIFNPMTIPSDT